jgi:hypothetical protein
MEKWEKILRQSDAKVRDLPAKSENWERLATDLAKAPPPGPHTSPGGSTPPWGWWTGGAVTVAVLAIAGYALFTGPSAPEKPMEPAVSATIPSVLPEDARDGRNSAPAPVPAPAPRTATEQLATTSSVTRPARPAANPARPGGDPASPSEPVATQASALAISERPTPHPKAASPSRSTADSGPTSLGDSAKEPGASLLAGSTTDTDRSASAAAPTSPEPMEPTTTIRMGEVDPLAVAGVQSLAIPPRDRSGFSPPPGLNEQRWRVWLSYGLHSFEVSPWVPFYRLEEEIPNQESILPEEGPEELFLVGEFQAFSAEEINNRYRFLLEHRVAKRLLAYGGLHHQRMVYRLDDERSDYTGTESDLLFRGRIRYRETGLEAGLTYQFKPFRWGLANTLNVLEFRAGAYYATERARIFDGTLRSEELPDELPFRYREELLPRSRWGFQVELVDRTQLSDRMDLLFSLGLFTSSDGIVRDVPLQVGIIRRL